jgi:hypothetical protein
MGHTRAGHHSKPAPRPDTEGVVDVFDLVELPIMLYALGPAENGRQSLWIFLLDCADSWVRVSIATRSFMLWRLTAHWISPGSRFPHRRASKRND